MWSITVSKGLSRKENIYIYIYAICLQLRRWVKIKNWKKKKNNFFWGVEWRDFKGLKSPFTKDSRRFWCVSGVSHAPKLCNLAANMSGSTDKDLGIFWQVRLTQCQSLSSSSYLKEAFLFFNIFQPRTGLLFHNSFLKSCIIDLTIYCIVINNYTISYYYRNLFKYYKILKLSLRLYILSDHESFAVWVHTWILVYDQTTWLK